jgi:hypothetical protein
MPMAIQKMSNSQKGAVASIANSFFALREQENTVSPSIRITEVAGPSLLCGTEHLRTATSLGKGESFDAGNKNPGRSGGGRHTKIPPTIPITTFKLSLEAMPVGRNSPTKFFLHRRSANFPT